MDRTAYLLITAGVALASGLISAAVNSWLAGRAQVSEELREARLKAYPSVWQLTGGVSTWPWTDATWADVERLHLDFRAWYYVRGGIFLSDNSRARYGELQELIEAHLEEPADRSAQLPGPVYQSLAGAGSAFRTALTEDLESRRQRSPFTRVALAVRHRRAQREAERRLKAAPSTRGHSLRVDSATTWTPPSTTQEG